MRQAALLSVSSAKGLFDDKFEWRQGGLMYFHNKLLCGQFVLPKDCSTTSMFATSLNGDKLVCDRFVHVKLTATGCRDSVISFSLFLVAKDKCIPEA